MVYVKMRRVNRDAQLDYLCSLPQVGPQRPFERLSFLLHHLIESFPAGSASSYAFTLKGSLICLLNTCDFSFQQLVSAGELTARSAPRKCVRSNYRLTLYT
jgi:hypothetical protein